MISLSIEGLKGKAKEAVLKEHQARGDIPTTATTGAKRQDEAAPRDPQTSKEEEFKDNARGKGEVRPDPVLVSPRKPVSDGASSSPCQEKEKDKDNDPDTKEKKKEELHAASVRILPRGRSLNSFPISLSHQPVNIKSEPKTEYQGVKEELPSYVEEYDERTMENYYQRESEGIAGDRLADEISSIDYLYDARPRPPRARRQKRSEGIYNAPEVPQHFSSLQQQEAQARQREYYSENPLEELVTITFNYIVDSLACLHPYRLSLVLLQICLTITIGIGIFVEFTFKRVVLAMSIPALLVNSQLLISEFRIYKKKKKKRLRELTWWGELVCFLTKTDTCKIHQQNYSSHPNPALPAHVEAWRRNMHIGRHRSIQLLERHHTANLQAKDDGRTFRVRFSDEQNAGRRLFLDIEVAGIPTRYLVDTGSEVTCLNASYLRDLESKVGRRFSKMAHTSRLVGVTGEAPPSMTSITSLDLCVRNGERRLFLDSVVHYCVEDAPFIGLLGQSVLECMETEITVRGPETYLRFKKVPDFGDVRISLDDTDKVGMEVATTTVLPPKEWTACEIVIPHSKNFASNWDGEPLLVEQNPAYKDHDIQFGEVTELKKGSTKIMVRNMQQVPMVLPAAMDMFHLSQLKQHTVEDGSPLVRAGFLATACNLGPLNTCICTLYQDSSVAFLANHHGVTQCGPSLLSRFDKDIQFAPGLHEKREGSKSTFFLIGDRFAQFRDFTESYVSDLLSKRRFHHNHLVLLVADPSQIDESLYAFVTELRRFVHVDLRTITASSICLNCQDEHLWQLSVIPGAQKVEKINILVPSMNGIEQNDVFSTLTQRKKGTNIHTFQKLETPCQIFLKNPGELTLAIHIPRAFTIKSEYVRNLFMVVLGDLKRICPFATLHIASNLPPKVNGLAQASIDEALHHSRWYHGFSHSLPEKSYGQKQGETEECDLKLPSCSCAFCDNNNRDTGKKVGFRYVRATAWPNFSEKELTSFLDHLEATDEATRKIIKVLALFNQKVPIKGESSNQVDDPQAEDLEPREGDQQEDPAWFEGSIQSSKAESTTSSQEIALQEAFGDIGFRYTRPGPYANTPLPQTRHAPLTIQEFYNEALQGHIEKLPSKKAIGPIIILHYLWRQIFKVKDTDYGVIQNLTMTIRAKRPYALLTGPRFLGGFPIRPFLHRVLRQIIETYVEDGLWSRNQHVILISQIFAVIRNSELKTTKGALCNIPEEELTPRDVRLIIDVRGVNMETIIQYTFTCLYVCVADLILSVLA